MGGHATIVFASVSRLIPPLCCRGFRCAKQESRYADIFFLYKKRAPSVQIFSLVCKPSIIISCSNDIMLRSIVTINHHQIQNVWMAALPRGKIGRQNVLGRHVAGARNVPVSQWCFFGDVACADMHSICMSITCEPHCFVAGVSVSVPKQIPGAVTPRTTITGAETNHEH